VCARAAAHRASLSQPVWDKLDLSLASRRNPLVRPAQRDEKASETAPTQSFTVWCELVSRSQKLSPFGAVIQCLICSKPQQLPPISIAPSLTKCHTNPGAHFSMSTLRWPRSGGHKQSECGATYTAIFILRIQPVTMWRNVTQRCLIYTSHPANLGNIMA
jgi:hypothetical protein